MGNPFAKADVIRDAKFWSAPAPYARQNPMTGEKMPATVTKKKTPEAQSQQAAGAAKRLAIITRKLSVPPSPPREETKRGSFEQVRFYPTNPPTTRSPSTVTRLNGGLTRSLPERSPNASPARPNPNNPDAAPKAPKQPPPKKLVIVLDR